MYSDALSSVDLTLTCSYGSAFFTPFFHEAVPFAPYRDRMDLEDMMIAFFFAPPPAGGAPIPPDPTPKFCVIIVQ